MRPSQKAKEERKWVVDTINKYFDVIVEEEDEPEEEEENDEEDWSCDSLEDEPVPEFKSTAKMRGLLSQALSKTAPDDPKQMLSSLKVKLGSQMSLKRMSMDNLTRI